MSESRLETEVKEKLKKPKFRKKKIEKLIRQLLVELQDDPDRPGLKGTPERVARMYEEIFSGMNKTGKDDLLVTFSSELIDISFSPFFNSKFL